MDTVTNPNHPKMHWVQYQLANDHNVVMSESDIWWAVYNDSGRNLRKAIEMLDHIAEDANSLKAFAFSFAHRQSILIQEVYPVGPAVIVGIVCFLTGIFAGTFL